jgi:hypothetical protein
VRIDRERACAWSPTPCCSPTSPPATSTRAPARQSPTLRASPPTVT